MAGTSSNNDAVRVVDMAVLAAIIGTSVLLCAGMLLTSLGGTGPSKIFTYHPVLMSVAYVLLMGSAIYTYRIGGSSGKGQRRSLHAGLSALGCLFAVGGYAAMYKAHADSGASQFGVGASLIRQVHVWTGYLVFVATLAQASVGALKYNRLLSTGERSLTFHGRMGQAVFVGGLLNTGIAAAFWDGWGVATKAAMYLGLAAVLGGIFLVESPGGPRRGDLKDDDDELGAVSEEDRDLVPVIGHSTR